MFHHYIRTELAKLGGTCKEMSLDCRQIETIINIQNTKL